VVGRAPALRAMMPLLKRGELAEGEEKAVRRSGTGIFWPQGLVLDRSRCSVRLEITPFVARACDIRFSCAGGSK
jgi:hypothetical protein